MADKKKGGSFIEKIAAVIVDKRNLFFLLYIFALVFCVFSMTWVQVENDVTVYLPEDTETRQGIVAMNENFATFGMARVMVSNVTYETAMEISETISAVDGVMMVTFDDTPEHYKDACALFDLNFAGAAMDADTVAAMDEIRHLLSGYDLAVDTTIGYDENAVLLRTELGALHVQGSDLKLKTLSPDGGQVAVSGTVTALVYEQPRQGGGVLRRLFG